MLLTRGHTRKLRVICASIERIIMSHWFPLKEPISVNVPSVLMTGYVYSDCNIVGSEWSKLSFSNFNQG